MSPEGRVVVEIRDGSPPEVRYERPGDVSRILKGKTRDEAVALVPMIYSICGVAQVQAASAALDAALGNKPDPEILLARQALVAMESLREQVLRIMLDWPVFLGGEARAREAANAMQLVARLKAALFEGDPFSIGAKPVADKASALAIIDEAEALLESLVFGMPPGRWLEFRGRQDVAEWAVTSGSVAGAFIGDILRKGEADMAVAPLIALEAPEPDGWIADGFLSAENSDGEVPETTLFSRYRNSEMLKSLESDGLLGRHAARLLELALLPARMRSLLHGDGETIATARREQDGIGLGVSRIEAARGDLVHVASVKDGRVTDFGIHPPTLLNFHPKGAAARCLSNAGPADIVADRDRLKRIAMLLINAIDPCVSYELKVD